MGFDMPSNWMSLHWGLNLSNSKFIFGRAKVRTDSFIDSILAGRKVFQGILSLLFGLTLSPISLGYLVMGRFWLSKLFFTSENCTGCGQCAKNCPVNAIKMVGSKKPRPYWTFNCESCMRCMGYCPNQAVEVSHSFALVLYYVSTIPVWVYFLSGLNSSLGLGCSLIIVQILLKYLYILLSFYVAYLILFWSIKIPLFNKLCTYTTLTHFYRRYHEPETELQDICVGNKNRKSPDAPG